jgi:hypothetical protein
MSCKLVRTDAYGNSKAYRCSEVRALQEEWKQEFRRINRTDEMEKSIGKDRFYEAYCREIDQFLWKCKCTQ